MTTDKTEVTKLINYIEENLRASPVAGLTFIDPRNFKARLFSKQNHVVFGRRGAGKSTLVSSLQGAGGHVAIELNMEDYKDISFPNIIVQVLSKSFTQLRQIIGDKAPWYKGNLAAVRVRSRLRATERELQKLLDEPDKEQRQVRTKTVQEDSASSEVGKGPVKIGGATKQGREEEVSRSIPVDKLGKLLIALPVYKNLFLQASRALRHRSIFLILDDFYFVPKSVQPEFIDFFHRLTKGTDLFLKIATIKHRSLMYKRTAESYVGVEQGHDVFEIDMDYTLDKFADLQAFMEQLLESAIDKSGAAISADLLFEGDGFAQLCLASGGVPRDFLSLFVRLANSVVISKGGQIGKVDVTQEAITNITSKIDQFKIDSADERQSLDVYLHEIKAFVYTENRTNAFLVAKHELEENPQERQAIRELVDLRLIHLVDSNTSSAPSDGRRYEAYILDVGLYDNSRPRNFNQVEPGAQDARARKDSLRASPRLPLGQLHISVKEAGYGQLVISDWK